MRNSRLDELVISTDKTFLRAIAVVAMLRMGRRSPRGYRSYTPWLARA